MYAVCQAELSVAAPGVGRCHAHSYNAVHIHTDAQIYPCCAGGVTGDPDDEAAAAAPAPQPAEDEEEVDEFAAQVAAECALQCLP
jgi:hypothetical protein